VCHDLDVGPFRYILFALVAASLCVYLYRGYRRWIAPPKEEPLDALDPARGLTPPTGSAPATPKPTSTPKAPRSYGFTNPTIVSDEEASSGESLVQAVIREELAKKRAAERGEPEPSDAAPPAGRSGLFASGGAGADRGRVSVAAALTGVRLPDSLVPLVGHDTQVDPHQVTFVSTTDGAAAIGSALGDELERLGYRLTSESDVVAVATKGEAELRITLYPDAANERVDGAARFPTAPGGSVVVEFRT
jgi:hypothetical protein